VRESQHRWIRIAGEEGGRTHHSLLVTCRLSPAATSILQTVSFPDLAARCSGVFLDVKSLLIHRNEDRNRCSIIKNSSCYSPKLLGKIPASKVPNPDQIWLLDLNDPRRPFQASGNPRQHHRLFLRSFLRKVANGSNLTADKGNFQVKKMHQQIVITLFLTIT